MLRWVRNDFVWHEKLRCHLSRARHAFSKGFSRTLLRNNEELVRGFYSLVLPSNKPAYISLRMLVSASRDWLRPCNERERELSFRNVETIVNGDLRVPHFVLLLSAPLASLLFSTSMLLLHIWAILTLNYFQGLHFFFISFSIFFIVSRFFYDARNFVLHRDSKLFKRRQIFFPCK